MIIWLASYPKSGNTWVKLFLSAYLGNPNASIPFDINKMLIPFSLFPTNKLIKKFNFDFSNFENIAEHWIQMQEYLNLGSKENILVKTHNAMCTINGNKFTNKQNSLGAIYLVRDPRDIVISYSSFLKKSHDEVAATIFNSKSFEQSNIDGKQFDFTLIGSWSDNYNSWKNYKSIEVLVIKYEDMISDTQNTFTKIIKYLNKIDNIKIDNEKIKSCINLTSFKNLRKIEEEKGFIEKGFGEFFFRKGRVGDWKDKLNQDLVKKIEEKFKLEMKELGYID
jgi:hypothetical protein